MPRRGRDGFTLIELLIVVAIILILIAIALPNFLEAMARAKVTRAKAEIRTFISALESYFTDWSNYPRAHFGFYPEQVFSHGARYGFIQLTSPIKYLSVIPMDPFGVMQDLTSRSFLRPGSWEGVKVMSYQGRSGSDSDYHEPCWGSSDPIPCGCGKMLGPGGQRYPRHNRGCIHAYVVESRGPDRAFHPGVGGVDHWPYPTRRMIQERGFGAVFTHSPTNGSKSPGDIYQMTGEWRKGYFVLDNWIVGHP